MSLKKLKQASLLSVIGLGLLIVNPLQVLAIPTLEFDDNLLHGGAVSYDGAGGAAIGTDIVIDRIGGTGVPLNDGVALDCVGCKLNFATGANISEGPAVWSFKEGGSFSISGDVNRTAADGGANVASGTLVTGSFTSSVALPMAVGSGSTITFLGFGVDTKNAELVAFYFATPPPSFNFANSAIQLGTTTIGPDGSFAGTVTSVDFANTPVPEPIPEPGTMLLMGSGLLGLGLWRKFKK